MKHSDLLHLHTALRTDDLGAIRDRALQLAHAGGLQPRPGQIIVAQIRNDSLRSQGIVVASHLRQRRCCLGFVVALPAEPDAEIHQAGVAVGDLIVYVRLSSRALQASPDSEIDWVSIRAANLEAVVDPG